MNTLQINPVPTSDSGQASPSNSPNKTLRLPPYFEKKGYRAIKVIGEGAYGKALLVSTAIAKPCTFSTAGIEGKSSQRNPPRLPERKKGEGFTSSQLPQDSTSQQVPPMIVIKHVNMSKFTKAERAAAKNEVEMLKRLNHPNIIRYYDSVEVDNDLYICLEYADGGDLAAKIKNRSRDSGAEIDSMISLFRQAVDAVRYMHSQKVLHRDLKPQNIFLSCDGTQVKVGDFGFSKALNYTFAMANTLCGTPYYYSPELCKGKPYNSASDVWALGVMFYEMISQKMPFDARTLPQLAAAICTKDPVRPKEISSEKSDPLWQLLCEILSKNPLGRPDCVFILRHPALRTLETSQISSASTKSIEPLLKETRSPSPSVVEQSPLYPHRRAPTPVSTPHLTAVRKDILPTPLQQNPPFVSERVYTTAGDGATRPPLGHHLARPQQPDPSLRPPSRHNQCPTLLPPRQPNYHGAPPSYAPNQLRERRDSIPETKNVSPSRRPSVQMLKVGSDNNLVGCNANLKGINDRHQNIFDNLKGLPVIQHPLRLPTPLKYSTMNTKIAIS